MHRPAPATAPGAAEPPGDPTEGAPTSPPLPQLARYFLGLGTWGFGGPIATVGYMQRDLVEDRCWMDRATFLDGVALGQTMPGPLAAQVAMWVGYVRRGALGALLVAGAFIAPSFLGVLAVAAVYRHFAGLDVVAWLFRGVSPVVIAIIARAAVKLARLTDRADRRLWAITVAIGVVTAATGSEIAPLFVAAGLLMVAVDAPPRWRDLAGHLASRRPGARAVAPAPLAAAALAARRGAPWLVLAGTAGLLTSVFLFFLVTGATVFGSGLAILPVLRAGVVGQHHWLSNRVLLDGLSVGLLTPGPVVIAATFLGYQIAGLAGAAVATVGIFLPIYAGVVLPGRWFVRHRHQRQVQAFVRGATAAAAGAIAGAVVVLGRQSIVDAPSALLAAGALLALARLRTPEPVLVAIGAAVGLAFLR